MTTHLTAPAATAGRCPHELLWGTCCWCPASQPTAPATTMTLHATVVVPTWYPTLCRNPACGRRSDLGELVGLVPGLGPCCASCAGLDPHSPKRPAGRRGWVA
jgi:hypothetical protein